MHIGILGAGKVAQAFARHALKAGHTVLVSNSKGPSSLSTLVEELGKGASAGTPEEALNSEAVLLAVPWRQIEKLVTGLNWDGQILIDSTNQFLLPDPGLADLHGTSAAEIVAGFAPRARYVKAFNNMFVKNFDDGPMVNGGKRLTFVCGDEPEAKEVVMNLIRQFGFEGIDLGSNATGGLVLQAGGPLAGRDLVELS